MTTKARLLLLALALALGAACGRDPRNTQPSLAGATEPPSIARLASGNPHRRVLVTDALVGLAFENGRLTIAAHDQGDAQRAHALARQAAALRQANRTIEALASARDALREDPAHAPALCELARALALLQRTDEARAAFTLLLNTNPSDGEARFELAMLLQGAGEHAAAIAELEKLIELDPRVGVAHARLAVLHYGRGDLDACQSALLTAAALGSPAPAQLTALLAQARRTTGPR